MSVLHSEHAPPPRPLPPPVLSLAHVAPCLQKNGAAIVQSEPQLSTNLCKQACSIYEHLHETHGSKSDTQDDGWNILFHLVCFIKAWQCDRALVLWAAWTYMQITDYLNKLNLERPHPKKKETWLIDVQIWQQTATTQHKSLLDVSVIKGSLCVTLRDLRSSPGCISAHFWAHSDWRSSSPPH